jgi:hypothetical protein
MTEETMTEEIVEKKGGNKGLMIGGVVVLLLLLAAAFVGGRLLAPKEETADLPPGAILSGEGPGLAVGGGAIPEGAETFMMPMPEAAPELPDRAPETMGLFIGRTDDTLTIGTGNVMARISNEPDAVPEFNYDGVAVEVLVTNQTELFEDVTEFTPGQTSVQQKVEKLENLDDLEENTTVQVWGQRDGDRIVAETIVIIRPPALAFPPQ